MNLIQITNFCCSKNTKLFIVHNSHILETFEDKKQTIVQFLQDCHGQTTTLTYKNYSFINELMQKLMQCKSIHLTDLTHDQCHNSKFNIYLFVYDFYNKICQEELIASNSIKISNIKFVDQQNAYKLKLFICEFYNRSSSNIVSVSILFDEYWNSTLYDFINNACKDIKRSSSFYEKKCLLLSFKFIYLNKNNILTFLSDSWNALVFYSTMSQLKQMHNCETLQLVNES
jgi:hypothetical protein